MNQSLKSQKPIRIKVNSNNTIYKEETINFYKRFFYENLQNVKNRPKALADLAQLIKKYQDREGSNVDYFTISLEIEAENILKEHFNQGVLEQFNKEIKVEFKPSNDFAKGFWEIFFYSITHNTEESKKRSKYRGEYLIFLYNCLNDYGLHKYIDERDLTHKRYNVILSYTDSNGYKNRDEKMLITFDKLKENYLTPYKLKSHLMINGKLIHFNKVLSIYITTTLIQDDEIPLLGLKNGWKWPPQEKYPSWLVLCGKEETDDLISNPYFQEPGTHLCISHKCIDELSKLNNPNFNFKKLVKLIEELNFNMAKGNYYSVSILIRTIVDHVPPLFNAKNFSAYVSALNKQSYRDIIVKLDALSRKIANLTLHQQISEKENLLTQTQVNVFAELETLLNEIVSEYK